MKPNLVTLSMGGGVQTITICRMIVDGELPKPDAAIFADTGDEPSYVYDQVNEIKQELACIGVPLLIVNNGNFHNDVYSGGRFAAMPLFTRNRTGNRGKKTKFSGPGLFNLSEFEVDEPTTIVGFGLEAQIETKGKMRRQCTREYKIEPIDREIKIMLLEMNLAKQITTKTGVEKIYINRGVLVETWIGYTLDEVERIKPSRQKWQAFKYPLIEKRLTKADCINWLTKKGYPVPLSSHCRKCPLIGDKRQIELMENDPAGYENRLQFDRDLRNGKLHISASVKGDLYLHSDCIPLDEVELNPDRPMLIGCVNHCMT